MTIPTKAESPSIDLDPYRIEKILQRAVREALLRHKQAGNPIAVWRNDRVEWIEPGDILPDEPPIPS